MGQKACGRRSEIQHYAVLFRWGMTRYEAMFRNEDEELNKLPTGIQLNEASVLLRLFDKHRRLWLRRSENLNLPFAATWMGVLSPDTFRFLIKDSPDFFARTNLFS